MNTASGRQVGRTSLPEVLATVWPVISATDSKLLARKKVAIRSGHLAMVIMLGAVVAVTILADFRQFSPARLLALVATSLVYVGWSLYGTHGPVRLVLCEEGTPPPLSTRLPRWGAVPYFGIQLGLAGLVYYLGDNGHRPSLLWLGLLPPVAYSVFLLERAGITLVSLGTVLVFVGNVVRWHGWAAVPYSVLAFAFALLFTLVFTLLTANSEKARDQVQRLAAELGEANTKLRTYAVQVEELAATRERNRLAREIHDTLGHYLTVVNVQLEAARALQEPDPAGAQQALEKAQRLTREGLQEIRCSVAALRSSPLENRSLAEALRALAQESRSEGLEVALGVLGQERRLAPQAELTLYRAGQEGLTNVRKHAQARKARLVLDFRGAATVRFTLSDDGRGAANPAEATAGFGLLGLRERALLLGGKVSVQTAPQAGFNLEVEVPT